MTDFATRDVDLGLGFTGEMRYVDGELHGVEVEGPRGVHCIHGKPRGEDRCGGWVPVQGPDQWTLVCEDPLTLTPSIRCSCDCDHAGEGQHGFITDGQWSNAGGITA